MFGIHDPITLDTLRDFEPCVNRSINRRSSWHEEDNDTLMFFTHDCNLHQHEHYSSLQKSSFFHHHSWYISMIAATEGLAKVLILRTAKTLQISGETEVLAVFLPQYHTPCFNLVFFSCKYQKTPIRDFLTILSRIFSTTLPTPEISNVLACGQCRGARNCGQQRKTVFP